MKYEYKLRQFKCSICGITFVIESDTDNPDVTTPPDKSGSFSATLRNKPKPKAPSELF